MCLDYDNTQQLRVVLAVQALSLQMALSQPHLALFLHLVILSGLFLVADSNFTCPCGQKIKISLADLVPCYHRDGPDGLLSSPTLTTPRSCDSFIYVATIQAMIYMTYLTNVPLINFENNCYILLPDIPTYENHLQVKLVFTHALRQIYNIMLVLTLL